MSIFKTLSQVENEFLFEKRNSKAMLEHAQILENFAHLLNQYNIQSVSELDEKIAIQLVNNLKQVNENKTTYIFLDTIDPNDSKLVNFLQKNKINAELIQKNGPSGYPILKYEGSNSALLNMYLKFWDENGHDDFYEFVGQNYF